MDFIFEGNFNGMKDIEAPFDVELDLTKEAAHEWKIRSREIFQIKESPSMPVLQLICQDKIGRFCFIFFGSLEAPCRKFFIFGN